MTEPVLWYRRPAETWNEALPVGHGALGAMCFGGVADALLRLNDETVWSGSPASELAAPLVTADEARDALAAAREAVADGREDLLRSAAHATERLPRPDDLGVSDPPGASTSTLPR